MRPGAARPPPRRFAAAACTFCGDCAAACQPLALVRGAGIPAWRYKAVVGPTCLPNKGVECRVCGDFCDVRAIRFTPRLDSSPLPAIDEDLCTGCGACLAPCPTAAIHIRS